VSNSGNQALNIREIEPEAVHRQNTVRVGDLVSIDFFTVPTATFRVLFVLVVLAHARSRIVHFNVTA
jgi:hypothetical protein